MIKDDLFEIKIEQKNGEILTPRVINKTEIFEVFDLNPVLVIDLKDNLEVEILDFNDKVFNYKDKQIRHEMELNLQKSHFDICVMFMKNGSLIYQYDCSLMLNIRALLNTTEKIEILEACNEHEFNDKFDNIFNIYITDLKDTKMSPDQTFFTNNRFLVFKFKNQVNFRLHIIAFNDFFLKEPYEIKGEFVKQNGVYYYITKTKFQMFGKYTFEFIGSKNQISTAVVFIKEALY